jgi:hypothetical protein
VRLQHAGSRNQPFPKTTKHRQIVYDVAMWNRHDRRMWNLWVFLLLSLTSCHWIAPYDAPASSDSNAFKDGSQDMRPGRHDSSADGPTDADMDVATDVADAAMDADAASDIADAAPDIADAAPDIVDAAPDIVDAAPDIVDAASDIVDATGYRRCRNGYRRCRTGYRLMRRPRRRWWPRAIRQTDTPPAAFTCRPRRFWSTTRCGPS